MNTLIIAFTQIATYIPEGIFGLIIVLLIAAIVALWKKLENKDKEIKEINAEHKAHINEKDALYKEALNHVLEGLKESNQIVHKITENISQMSKPIREDIIDHDKRVFSLITEIKATIDSMKNK
jgi:predicted Holliday junction resolvase-like endonuclease